MTKFVYTGFFLVFWVLLLNLSPTLAAETAPPDAKIREAKALRIKKDYAIYVVRYENDSDSYMVRLENAPGVGPNITTLEWLLDAVDNGSNAKEFKRHPNRLVGAYFNLKKTLWLLSDEEVEKRRLSRSQKKSSP